MQRLLLLFATAILICEDHATSQTATGKIMNEDRLRELVQDRLAVGKLEFIERKDDDSLTVYQYFLMQGDTLHKVLVNARTGRVDTVEVEQQNGRAQLRARQIAQTRAELAALKAVAGEIIRWKLKKSEGEWFYKFRIATQQGKLKDVFVDCDSFAVRRVRTHDQSALEP